MEVEESSDKESSDEDFSEEEIELRPIKKAPWIGLLKYDSDKFAKIWGWEMLLPYKGDPDWPDYCNYIGQYYERHQSFITEVTGSGLVDAAETCLKKEGELVSLWDSAMKECTVEILPINTFILSSLIKDFADKVECPGKTFSDVSTAALLCITKEADLICKMLSVGAKPSNYTIIQSTNIRMCALSLTSHQLRDSVPAAAAMLGIMKETNKICDWIRRNDKAFNTSDKNLDHDFELGRQVRQGTLHFMTILLEKSPFPVSSAAAEQKPVEEKYFSGNIPRNDENCIVPAEAANSTGGSTQDQENITSTDSSKRRMEDADKEASDQAEFGSYPSGSKLSKRGGRYCNQNEICTDKDRMALDSPFEDSEECDDANTVPPVGIAKFVVMILAVITSAQSNLIQEHAHSFIFSEDGGLPVASTVAFACISKEADLICELLKHGAEPTDGIIQHSIMIRMCALSLMHLQGSTAIAVAAAAMVGITKECKLMCDWIKKEDKPITFSIFTRHEPLECRLIRARTLDVMLSILKESSFPSSKVSGMVYQNGAAVGFLLATPCFGGAFQILNAAMPFCL
ncbi:hypothetical protein HU200_067544 [Digitaria exilis]|uniref:Uncharacterized protein n=1 Tax=Digitaria exilis TaxID=1010633 RepID=A0A834ZZC2_9POAL|nr:hypothetical protein HU200_067544 [Digitaria exilis]